MEAKIKQKPTMNEMKIYCENCKKEFTIWTPLRFFDIYKLYKNPKKFFECPYCKRIPDSIELKSGKYYLHFEKTEPKPMNETIQEAQKVEELKNKVEEIDEDLVNLIKEMINERYENVEDISELFVVDWMVEKIREFAKNEFSIDFCIRELIKEEDKWMDKMDADELIDYIEMEYANNPIVDSFVYLLLKNEISIGENEILKLIERRKPEKPQTKMILKDEAREYEAKKERAWKILEKHIQPIMNEILKEWESKKQEFNDFDEWEKYCLNYPSLSKIPERFHPLIEEVFENEKGLNYYYFWEVLNWDYHQVVPEKPTGSGEKSAKSQF